MRSWPALEAHAVSMDTGKARPSRLSWFQSGPSDKDAPVLVMVHGLGDEADSFRHLFPLLSGEFRLLAIDLPGFGRSTTAGPTTMDLCVAAIIAVLDEVKIARAYFVGSSIGAAIVQLLAFTHPGRASGLVLLDGGMPSRAKPAPGLLAMAAPFIGYRRYTAFRADHEGAIASLFPYYADFHALPEDDRGFLSGRVIDRVESDAQRRAYLSLLRSAIATAILREGDFVRGLRAWEGPLAIAWGSKDGVVPREAGKALAATQPGATFHLVEGAGHLPQQERPHEIAAIIAGLFA